MESVQDNGAPRNREELIDRIEQGWRAWVDAVEGIPDNRLSEPAVGHWSTKDLLGHIAFWEDWAIGYCRRIIAGEPEPEEDSDAINEGQVAESKGKTAAEQKRYRDEAHARLAAFLPSIRDDDPQFARLVEALGGETWGHFDEHSAQVRAWRAAEGM
jgi:hypothetical protein